MNKLLYRWGNTALFPIVIAGDTSWIHPEDWVVLKNYEYIGCLHRCVALGDEYITIEFWDIRIRVKPSVFYPIDNIPDFLPGDQVKLITTKGKMEIGTIKGIKFHGKNSEIFYDVEVNGKIKGRRYLSEDLEEVVF